ncbi:hypothetical protein LCGC14_1948620 [marine sediment metagenome]|uniref:AAA+ ATPase domain-containing protein n=1 Tax=marine sediment metagenome TaxID=412755 RepID=A0A0F9HWF8_9ZZZZ
MNKLKDLIWIEKYRPSTLSDVILSDENRKIIENNIKGNIHSFIFYSNKPGTGKTTTAKAIINDLGCDYLLINSSDERGIDVIRDKIKSFSISLSSSGTKRCIFLDEADGLTKIAQDSLRNLMEVHSDNCFFILSCNDLNKIIEPIQSRCIAVNFTNPNITEVEAKLTYILDKEELSINQDIDKFISKFYPDIRSMIKRLQEIRLGRKENDTEDYEDLFKIVKFKKFETIKKIVYSGELDILDFNKWLFEYIFSNLEKYGLEVTSKICNLLADTEKYSGFGVNLEVVFLANILEVSKLL